MAKQLVMVKSLTMTGSRFALASIIAGGLFVLLLSSLHLLEPEFDPTWRFTSEYALGDFGWMMHLAFGLLALAQISVAITIFPHIRTVTGYIGLVILGISAIGVIIAGIFVTDPITVSPDDATFSGSMHSIGAMLDYTPVAALLISLSLSRLDVWRPMKRVLLTSAIIAIVAMLLFVLQIPQDGQFGPGVLAGMFGRFLILADIAWLTIVGIHATKLGASKKM
ncbi:DUF998 domain-containing protein [Paenibacillus glucanolyticus]|uniref:DUF998 domain-containing protein n=1 Tax=Paenibacillus TaxID=44249 RepID=UPI0003E1DFBB|nr:MULTISPECIES: DUF998 domain-containing protein [Paenibacillus]MCA4751008.1 DUF998 domain-containing protein [Mycolicibacterium fortuitum]AVV58497.1 DUF998 domain-containing protein [Paenibacillus glucanolyticus]ETT40103.1 hypothetical protein C169_08753 [Paenibacillus sp. FSL R5-808]MPY20957.1 DUF998 domain-containing protein [Paenibacillus glucanolyticus]OMF73255.1 hypothetical protein BK142_18730 [Paenibacillus glucanolyticus]